MDEEKMDLELTDESKEAQTVNDVAKEMNAKRKMTNDEIEENKKSIEAAEKQINALKKKIAESEKSLKKHRNSIRTHHLILIAVDLIEILGFKEDENKCVSKGDFENLKNDVILKVKKLMKKKPKGKISEYEKLIEALGLQKEDEEFSSSGDIKKLKQVVYDKLETVLPDTDQSKEVSGDYVAERGNE